MMDDFIWAVGLLTLAGLGGAASQLLVELVRDCWQAAVFTRRVLNLYPEYNHWNPRRWWRIVRMWNEFAWSPPTRVWRDGYGEARWPGTEQEEWIDG